MRRRTKRLGALAIAIAIVATGASPVQAELTQRGNLFVNFNGGILPRALPRHVAVPIAVRISGRVRSLAGDHPPALRRIRIALSGSGRIDTRGLPVCPLSRISSSSPSVALATCGAALVGSGTYVASTAYPEQPSFLSRGRILAFNARSGGQPAILAHIYGTEPAPITRVIVFHLHKSAGTYGTVLTGSLPPTVNHFDSVEQIGLTLHRRFLYRGRMHSYLSAACAAPAGFPGAVFSFAHVSMGFADGRSLTTTLVRNCKVRASGDPPSPAG
jgi:hypothetical protein